MTNREARYRLHIGIFIAALAAMAGVFFALQSLLTPPIEMTRFRNSLLASVGQSADFDWNAGQPPADFRQESLPAPAAFREIADLGRQQDTVRAMNALVEHLRARPKRRGPIQSDTLETYRIIRAEGRGYCADYTQVFNALAYTAALPVREWGMSFDRFSGDGHAFSEVYDRDAGQWIFVDPMHGFFVRDRASGRPLSVLDFRQRLLDLDSFDSLEIVPIGNAFMFDSPREAYEYYRAGVDQFYLWFGNDVLSYDEHLLVRLLGPISRPLEQLAAILAGVHPKIRILPTASNRDEIDDLFALRTRVIALTAAAALLGMVVLAQAVWLIRERRRRARTA